MRLTKTVFDHASLTGLTDVADHPGYLTLDGLREMAGNLAVNGQEYSVLPSTLTPSGTSQIIDWDDGNVQVVDLGSASGDVTLTLSNPVAGASYILKIIQGATARNISWPGTVLWQGGDIPTITTTNDAIDIITLLWDGINYFCNVGQDYQ